MSAVINGPYSTEVLSVVPSPVTNKVDSLRQVTPIWYKTYMRRFANAADARPMQTKAEGAKEDR